MQLASWIKCQLKCVLNIDLMQLFNLLLYLSPGTFAYLCIWWWRHTWILHEDQLGRFYWHGSAIILHRYGLNYSWIHGCSTWICQVLKEMKCVYELDLMFAFCYMRIQCFFSNVGLIETCYFGLVVEGLMADLLWLFIHGFVYCS